MKISKFSLVVCGVLSLLLQVGCTPEPAPVIPKTTLDIETTPAGASVVVDGREAGVTPLKLAVDHNGHFIILKLAGYRSAYHRIADGEPLVTDISIPLERHTAALILESEPTGASVRVNGEDGGTTPVTLPRQPIGSTRIEMSMVGYSPFSREVTLNDSRPRRVIGSLETTTGTLNVATEPSGADVYVNGEFKGRTPSVGGTIKVPDLPEGRHEISARLSGYRDSALTVLIKRNETKRIDLPALEKLPGSLKVSSVPAGATVLDGAKVLGKAPLNLRNLAPGTLTLTFQLEGFDPVRRTAVVEPGSTISVVGVMSRNVGGLSLATEPPNCSVYLNRELVGKTRRSDNENVSREFRIQDLKDGMVEIDVTHPLYYPATRKVAVRRGETARIGVVKLRKRWIPDYELEKRNGGTSRGVLIQRSPDGTIIFEAIKGVRIEYGKHEYIRLTPLELPTKDEPPPRK